MHNLVLTITVCEVVGRQHHCSCHALKGEGAEEVGSQQLSLLLPADAMMPMTTMGGQTLAHGKEARGDVLLWKKQVEPF